LNYIYQSLWSEIDLTPVRSLSPSTCLT